MNLVRKHYYDIIVEDLLIKNQVKKNQAFPKITKITLSAKFNGSYKGSIIALFEILTFQKPYITQSRTNNVSLNIRKGEPVGVKLVLRKKYIYDFLIYFLFEILPSIKKANTFSIKSKALHWQIKDIFAIEETNQLYIYLIDIKEFDIAIEGNNLDSNFFTAYRFPIQKLK